jgi:hypothetical protein
LGLGYPAGVLLSCTVRVLAAPPGRLMADDAACHFANAIKDSSLLSIAERYLTRANKRSHIANITILGHDAVGINLVHLRITSALRCFRLE